MTIILATLFVCLSLRDEFSPLPQVVVVVAVGPNRPEGFHGNAQISFHFARFIQTEFIFSSSIAGV